jgi:predicted transcriptional regulator
MYYALDGREDDLVAALPSAEAGKLIPTLEVERFREAVDDYRYLLALEQAIAAPVNPQAAATARVWLDNLMAGLTVDHTELADPPFDAADLDAIRAVARQFIIEVLGLSTE